MTNSSDIKAVFTDKLFTDPDGDKAFNLKISFIPSRFVIREYWMPGGNNGFTSYSDLTRYNDEYFYNNTNQTQWFQADYFYEVSTFPGDPVGKNFETSINLDIGSTNKECATRDWNSTVQYAQYEKTDEQYSYYGETNLIKK